MCGDARGAEEADAGMGVRVIQRSDNGNSMAVLAFVLGGREVIVMVRGKASGKHLAMYELTAQEARDMAEYLIRCADFSEGKDV